MLQPAKRNHPPTPTTNHSCMNNGKCEKYRIRCESDLNDYHVRFILCFGRCIVKLWCANFSDGVIQNPGHLKIVTLLVSKDF